MRSLFRENRSLSTLGSTVTNCSVLGMIEHCGRIEVMNDISRSRLPKFSFETKTTRSREIYYHTTSYNDFALPTRGEIFTVIEEAKLEAIRDTRKLGVQMDQNFNYTCNISSHENIRPKSRPQMRMRTWKNGDRLERFEGLQLTKKPVC